MKQLVVNGYKILMLTTNLDRPEAYLALGIADREADVTLICDPGSPFQDILAGSTVKLLHYRVKSRFDPQAIKYFRKIMRAEKFSVVHTFSSRTLSNALWAAIGLGIKQVTYRGTMGHLSRFDPAAWLAHLNPRISRIVCVSNAVKDYLRSVGVPDRRLTTIYKGHSIEWYEEMRAADLTSLGIPAGAFVVSCTANIRAVKGVDVLIEAEALLARNLNVHLLLIGEARDPKVLEMARKSPNRERLHFTGFRSDAVSLVRSSQAFCMPSVTREGLPKAMFEAMSVGVPVIVSKVGGMPEVIKDGENGLVVPPADSAAIAEAISRLASDRQFARKLGNAGLESVINRFSNATTIDQTLRVYSEVTADSVR